jgi:putative hydrolase of the HAD superfamily
MVFFDLVGTLIRPAGSIGTQYGELARRLGVEADSQELDRAFNQAMRAAPPIALAGRPPAQVPSLEKGWWRHLVRDVVHRAGLSTALEGSRFEAYFDSLYRHFETEAAWVVYSDVVPALSRLRSGGRRVGLITNYDARVYPLLDALHLRAWFDCVAIPGLAGAAKPDPAIFRYAMERAEVAAKRAVYVGDLVEEDVNGARAAGMHPILLDRDRCHHAGAGVVRIESLEDLDWALDLAGWRNPQPDGGTSSAPKTAQN